MDIDLIRRLAIPGDTKVVLCVLDGLGGLPGPRGRTELEEAHARHLDRLAEAGTVGQTLPVGYGITPGSGPGHLALFGYDPLQFEVGRGALEATGIDFALGPADLAARRPGGRVRAAASAAAPAEESPGSTGQGGC